MSHSDVKRKLLVVLWKMREKKKKQFAVYAAVAALGLTIAMTLFVWRYYIRTIERNELEETAGARQFARHYVIISDESSKLWDNICKSAQTAGKNLDAWVERLGEWFADEYSAVDYMDIAIAAKVDGIIVKPNGTLSMRKAINKAEEAGIPVVTVLEDETRSERTSFVGINSYQLGTTYGEQVLKCVKEDTQSVLVLLNGSDPGRELIFKQLKATVQEGLGADREIGISPMSFMPQNAFDAEEVIRDIFLAEDKRPDILVCMNEADSERAYQAMIDYNCIGDVELVGYYQSQMILNAIQKGTVPMAIAVDAEHIGTCCVEALEEYAQMGHASSYFSVNLDIVTQENVEQYLEQKEE